MSMVEVVRLAGQNRRVMEKASPYHFKVYFDVMFACKTPICVAVY